MPVTRPLLEQTQNAVEWKRYTREGFHHPRGSQQAFLRGRAHLYTSVPYHCRVQYAGQRGVAVEGGNVPTRAWFLHLHIVTAGGFRCVVLSLTTQSWGM